MLTLETRMYGLRPEDESRCLTGARYGSWNEQLSNNVVFFSFLFICCAKPLSRIWTRTPGLCCPSSLASTASSVGARTSDLLWWTTSYHALYACTSSLTWRAPHTRDEHPRRKERSPSLLIKIWTFWVMSPRASPWTMTRTALWSKHFKETAWWERETDREEFDAHIFLK